MAADLRQEPVYPVREVARYLGIPVSTLRAWIGGTEPVLAHVDTVTGRLSFFDLVEAHVLRAAVRGRLPQASIRRGIRYLRERFNEADRPLLDLEYLTDGKSLLVRGLLDRPSDEVLVNASQYGQLEMEQALQAHLSMIFRGEDGRPAALAPQAGVVIRPGVMEGRPVIAGTRIPTGFVAQRAQAGESVEDLASFYGIDANKVRSALEYERAA